MFRPQNREECLGPSDLPSSLLAVALPRAKAGQTSGEPQLHRNRLRRKSQGFGCLQTFITSAKISQAFEWHTSMKDLSLCNRFTTQKALHLLSSTPFFLVRKSLLSISNKWRSSMGEHWTSSHRPCVTSASPGLSPQSALTASAGHSPGRQQRPKPSGVSGQVWCPSEAWHSWVGGSKEAGSKEHVSLYWAAGLSCEAMLLGKFGASMK